MESRQRRVWHQAAGALFYTRFAQCHARLRRGSIQRAGALIPYQACGLDNKKAKEQPRGSPFLLLAINRTIDKKPVNPPQGVRDPPNTPQLIAFCSCI